MYQFASICRQRKKVVESLGIDTHILDIMTSVEHATHVDSNTVKRASGPYSSTFHAGASGVCSNAMQCRSHAVDKVVSMELPETTHVVQLDITGLNGSKEACDMGKSGTKNRQLAHLSYEWSAILSIRCPSESSSNQV